VTRIGVIAHSGKAMEGGLGALRDELDRIGRSDALWYEVPKSKYVGDAVAKALADGVDLIYVWGGDGTVQRCIDAVAKADDPVPISILPAGTANLLALNLGIPTTIEAAVAVGIDGVRREMDTGTVNGEHFAVMAGAGLDALMIRDADGTLKDRLGRAAYLLTGARNLRTSPVSAEITVDGNRLYKGVITCVIVGNVGRVLGGLELFSGTRLDDGQLEVGVVTAKSVAQWARTIGRAVAGRPENSPFIITSRGAKIVVRLDSSIPYELDGGVRTSERKLKFRARRSSVVMCLPIETADALFPTEADDSAGHRPDDARVAVGDPA
jgi:diacylglycerol kinase (ATP)